MPNNEFKVNNQAPQGLNLRSAPDPTQNNILAVIPPGHKVIKLEDADVPNWWRIETTLTGAAATGFVNKKFLSPADEVTEPAQSGVRACHLSTSGLSVTLQNFRRAHPLTSEPPVRRRSDQTPQERVSAIRQLIDWFRVENSPRYLPGGGNTFCNIYAYDYCYMTGAFLPRVWWEQTAIIKLEAGQNVPVQYDTTVDEITANSLNGWFKQWGP